MQGLDRRRLAPEVRRLEIIEAAERLLKRAGSEVRVIDVVREAGAAKGTFFLYFPTRNDLLVALRDRIIVAFDDAHPIQLETTSRADWPRTIDRLAVAFVDSVVAMGGLHGVLFHSDFAWRRPVRGGDHPIYRLTAIVKAGQKAGAFAAADAPLVARLLFAVIHEAADLVAAGGDRKRVLAAMRFMLRRTLEPEAP